MLFATIAAWADPSTYTFVCPADVLEFSYSKAITTSYNNGEYYVTGEFASADRYSTMTISVQNAYSDQYKLVSVSSADGTFSVADGQNSIFFMPAYAPAPSTWTVNFEGTGNDDQDQQGWIINGPRGLYVYYTSGYRSYSYDDGKYVLDDLTAYGNVEISVESSFLKTLQIDKVTAENGSEYLPANGKVTIPVSDFVDETTNELSPMTFTVETSTPAPTLTYSATVTLMNGEVYLASVYVGNHEYDFYSGKTQTIEFNPEADNIFFSTMTKPFSLTIAGKDVADLWGSENDYGVSGILLTPGSVDYPADGARIEIFMENPNPELIPVTFSFTNDGTQNFISDLMVGNTYLVGDEFINAMNNGLELKPGTNFNMIFNNIDYEINSIKLNGNEIASSTKGIESWGTTIVSALAFEFDVTLLEGNHVTFNVPDYYENIVITNRDGGDYTLSQATETIEFSHLVTSIKVMAESGYSIAEQGVSILLPGQDEPILTYGGTYFDVVDGMTVSVTVTKDIPASEKQFTIYSEADVLEFSGVSIDTDGNYADAAPTVTWTAAVAEGQPGYYTLTNLPNTSLYANVKAANQQDYKIDYLDYQGQKIYSSGNYGISVTLPINQISGNAEFTVVYKVEVEPVFITINVNNPSCISRIYNDNVRMTTFPYQYDLNDGASLLIELRSNCTLNSVTINGESVLTGMTINLANAAEGDVVEVDVTADNGDYIYTFIAPEGLSITYNSIGATFEDGIYTVSNIYQSSIDMYPIFISVAPGYENQIALTEVTDGTSTWEVNQSSGQIIIPASELPHASTTFRVTYGTPDPSETTRTITLTIDDINAVMYGHYQGGTSAYFSFQESGDSNEGSANLTISPNQYEVRIVTTVAIKSITTDATVLNFTIPQLPATEIVLDLHNVVDNQTINLYTKDGNGINSILNGNAAEEIFNLNGVKVNGSNLAPGIYIVGGQKVYIK